MNARHIPILLGLILISFGGIHFATVASAASNDYSPVLAYEEALPHFEYETSAVPFAVKILSEKKLDGVIIQSITYAAYDARFSSLGTGRNVAYLIRPAGKGPFAAVLLQHEYGSTAGNRDEFYDDAVALAQHGMVCLLPEGITPWKITFTGDGATDQKHIIQQIIELRRGIDLLIAQPGVDPHRIAYVGHDYGALHGCLLAGVEKRVKTYIIMAARGSYSDWINYFTPPSDEDEYHKIMAGTDPINYISHAAPSTLLFQFGNNDKFVAWAAADQLYEAASQPKTILRYDGTDHELEMNDQTFQDREKWLTSELGLASSPK